MSGVQHLQGNCGLDENLRVTFTGVNWGGGKTLLVRIVGGKQECLCGT